MDKIQMCLWLFLHMHALVVTAYLRIAANITRDCLPERAVPEDNVLLAGYFGHDFNHI